MSLFSRHPHISSISSSFSFVQKVLLGAAVILAADLATPDIAKAQKVGASGLPLPRFVSLKAKRVNMRVGPGRDYQVQWLYLKKSLPMEIIQEYGNWRKVRDPRGDEGWILHSLLSGKRVAIVRPWDMPDRTVTDHSSAKKLVSEQEFKPLPTINMYSSNKNTSKIIARLEAGSIASIDHCENDWCQLNVAHVDNTITGYVQQAQIWGVYPDETIDN